MKKIIEPKEYTKEEILRITEKYVRTTHDFYQKMNCGFETFGEWKKKNPTHRLANRNYPDDEYVIIISNYFKYFEEKYAEEVVDCGF